MRTALLVLALLLAAPASAQDGIYVANQGNFSDGDGSVTQLPFFYESGGAPTQLFEGQLGTILQSATLIDDRLYLVGNSANKIDVVDARTNARIGEITGGFSGPRYLEDIGLRPGKAYVTNQVYGGTSFVLPVDLAARTTGAPIPVDGLPETLAVVGDSVYVALGTFGPGGGGRDSLAVLDARLDRLTGYIDIGCYARFVVTPVFSDDVLAFCEDTDEMVVLNAQTRGIVQRLAFGEDIGDPFGVGQTVGPGVVYIATRTANPSTATYFVIVESGVAEVDFDYREDRFEIARTIPIPEVEDRPISAVALTRGSDLVLGRPDPDNPFTADGTITVHGEDGRLLATYPAGIYPVHVAIQESYPSAAERVDPAALGLAVAGPNPARGRTALAFALDRPTSVRVTVHDLLGRTVLVAGDGVRGAGPHRLDLDVSALAAGVYRVRLVADGRAASVPLTVAR